MLNFKYRYVGFGTQFTELRDGLRSSAGGADEPPEAVFRNEVVTDVGGVCLGCRHESRPILDHHFVRDDDGQFPSAAAAVLHQARRLIELRDGLIAAASRDTREGAPLDFWLVTHREPDFDALCSLYLARALLSGEIPADGWEAFGIRPDGWLPFENDRPRKIKWFKPFVTGLPAERRWPILLAGYAACVNNGRRLACPKNRSLHSILYAAAHRGRDYGRETDPADEPNGQPAPHLAGAREFFDEVRQRLSDLHSPLNPRFDSVLEHSTVFAPELALLDRELPAYDRDLRRARRTIVLVPKSAEDFDSWYQEAQRTPLRTANGRNGAGANLALPVAPSGAADRSAYQQVDGLYLRDPECLLFKEWARGDTDHSTQGRGFVFTAIAYSGGRDSSSNHSDYFFSLNPEVAQPERLHLYHVWEQLQAREAAAWAKCRPPLPLPEKRICRKGFQGRAGRHCKPPAKPDGHWLLPQGDAADLSDDEFAALSFIDPWFDGANYAATIVPTPNRGTLLGEGTAPDLSDDPVAAIVQRELEQSIFKPVMHIKELSFKRPLCGESKSDNRSAAVLGAEAAPGIAHEPSIFLGGDASRTGADGFVQHPLFDAEPLPLRDDHWRFGHVRLKDGVNLAAGPMAEQIGRVLWHQLEPQSSRSLPRDFLERHLLHGRDWVGVWSRHGIMMAWLPGSPDRVVEFLDPFARLAALSGEIEEYCGPLTSERRAAGERAASGSPSPRQAWDQETEEAIERRLEIGQDLSRRVADYRRELALLDHRLLDRFFDALNMGSVLAAVHEIHRSSADREMNRKQILISAGIDRGIKNSAAVQAKLHVLELLVAGAYVVEFLTMLHDSFPPEVREADHYFRLWSPTLMLVMSLVAALVAFRYVALVAHSHAGAATDAAEAKQAHADTVRRRWFLFLMLLPAILFFAFGTYRQWQTPPKKEQPPSSERGAPPPADGSRPVSEPETN